MNHDSANAPRETIDRIIVELERLMDEACDKWRLPKSDDPVRFAGWHNRELAYQERLQPFGDVSLAQAPLLLEDGPRM
jgi:hypothetical protein